MTPDKARVAEIARGLTKAQRAALVSACTTHSDVGGEPFVTVDFTDPWPAPIAQFVTVRTDRLTPLGLAVRAYLQSEQPA